MERDCNRRTFTRTCANPGSADESRSARIKASPTCHPRASPMTVRQFDYPGFVDDDVPDARDGFTRKERVVLWVLARLQAERGDRNVPLPLLYGHVIEH